MALKKNNSQLLLPDNGLTIDMIEEKMVVIDVDGDIGTVLSCDDIHNVHVLFPKGGTGLFCLDRTCFEYTPLYLHVK